MFALACLCGKVLSLGYRRQSLFIILLVGLLGVGFPTNIKDSPAVCRELRTVAQISFVAIRVRIFFSPVGREEVSVEAILLVGIIA